MLDQFEHAGIHHFPQDHARFLERVVGREDLTVHKRTALRFVCLDFRDGARFLAPSMVDKVFGVHAELPVEHFGVQGGYAGKVLRAMACQTPRDARSDAPDVRDRAVKPDLLLERAFVQETDVVGRVLGRDVQGYFGQEQVRSHAGGSTDAGLLENGGHERSRECARIHAVKGKIRRSVDEAFVNRVDVHVFRAYKSQVNGVNAGRDFHIASHARSGHGVVDAVGNFEHATTVLYAERFHGRRDGQADSGARTFGVGNDQVVHERV